MKLKSNIKIFFFSNDNFQSAKQYLHNITTYKLIKNGSNSIYENNCGKTIVYKTKLIIIKINQKQFS